MPRDVAYGHEITVDSGATTAANSAASAANAAATRADDAADRVENSEDDARNFAIAVSSFVSIIDGLTYDKGAKGHAIDAAASVAAAQAISDAMDALLDSLSIPNPFGVGKAVIDGYTLVAADEGRSVTAAGDLNVPDLDLEWTRPLIIDFDAESTLTAANANVTINGVAGGVFAFGAGDGAMLIPKSTAKTYRLLEMNQKIANP